MARPTTVTFDSRLHARARRLQVLCVLKWSMFGHGGRSKRGRAPDEDEAVKPSLKEEGERIDGVRFEKAYQIT